MKIISGFFFFKNVKEEASNSLKDLSPADLH